MSMASMSNAVIDERSSLDGRRQSWSLPRQQLSLQISARRTIEEGFDTGVAASHGHPEKGRYSPRIPVDRTESTGNIKPIDDTIDRDLPS